MPETETQFLRKNPVAGFMLILYRCSVMGALALIGYFGKYEFESTKADIKQLGSTTEETQMAVIRLEGRVTALEGSVKEGIARSEFSAALEMRDLEIADLKKEIENLRRRIAPPQQRQAP